MMYQIDFAEAFFPNIDTGPVSELIHSVTTVYNIDLCVNGQLFRIDDSIYKYEYIRKDPSRLLTRNFNILQLSVGLDEKQFLSMTGERDLTAMIELQMIDYVDPTVVKPALLTKNIHLLKLLDSDGKEIDVSPETKRSIDEIKVINYLTKISTQYYPIPSKDYFTVTLSDTTTATEALDALKLTSYVSVSNTAVDTLLEAFDQIQSCSSRGIVSDSLGAGRFLVKPTIVNKKIQKTTLENLLSEIETVCEKLQKQSGLTMYSDDISIIIGVDQMTYLLLATFGNNFNLNGNFNVQVVTTTDTRVEGKIFIGFGVFDKNRNAIPNPLNFGCLLYSDKVTVNENNCSIETSYRHILNLPVMGLLETENNG